MTEPGTPPRPPRSTAEYRWTSAKARDFLRGLAATGSVATAARGVGMSRQSAYNLRWRLTRQAEPQFARLWDEALAFARWTKREAARARVEARRARRRRPARGAGGAS